MCFLKIIDVRFFNKPDGGDIRINRGEEGPGFSLISSILTPLHATAFVLC